MPGGDRPAGAGLPGAALGGRGSRGPRALARDLGEATPLEIDRRLRAAIVFHAPPEVASLFLRMLARAGSLERLLAHAIATWVREGEAFRGYAGGHDGVVEIRGRAPDGLVFAFGGERYGSGDAPGLSDVLLEAYDRLIPE